MIWVRGVREESPDHSSGREPLVNWFLLGDEVVASPLSMPARRLSVRQLAGGCAELGRTKETSRAVVLDSTPCRSHRRRRDAAHRAPRSGSFVDEGDEELGDDARHGRTKARRFRTSPPSGLEADVRARQKRCAMKPRPVKVVRTSRTARRSTFPAASRRRDLGHTDAPLPLVSDAARRRVRRADAICSYNPLTGGSAPDDAEGVHATTSLRRWLRSTAWPASEFFSALLPGHGDPIRIAGRRGRPRERPRPD